MAKRLKNGQILMNDGRLVDPYPKAKRKPTMKPKNPLGHLPKKIQKIIRTVAEAYEDVADGSLQVGFAIKRKKLGEKVFWDIRVYPHGHDQWEVHLGDFIDLMSSGGVWFASGGDTHFSVRFWLDGSPQGDSADVILFGHDNASFDLLRKDLESEDWEVINDKVTELD